MHRSLELEEILRYIFEFLNGDPEGPQNRSLANLAITCRTFSHPALETLWFHLPSLCFAVMCLPQDAWKRGKESGDPTLFIRRTLVAADLERLQLYAPFVKSCRIGSLDVDAGVFRALKMFYRANTPVFPNLRVLTWSVAKDNEWYLDMFLTANLLDFSSSYASPGMMKSLKQTCNRLRRLNLPHVYGSRKLISSISNLVMHLPTLGSICSSVPLTDNAILHLSTSPDLETLQVPNDVTNFLRVNASYPNNPILSNLVTLHTKAQNLKSVISLLAQCHPKKLQHLMVTTPDIRDDDDAERLFVEIASSCSHHVFQSFTLSTSGIRWYQFPPLVSDPFLPACVLQHLFTFKHLRKLRLCLAFDLDDNVVEQMAISWPRLHHMVLEFPTRDHSKVTLRGLVSLARHCPDLVFLTIALHISSHDLESLEKDLEDLQQHRMMSFRLEGGWIDDDVDLGHVASFLKALFPHLLMVYNHSRRQQEIWNEVNRHLKLVSAES